MDKSLKFEISLSNKELWLLKTAKNIVGTGKNIKKKKCKLKVNQRPPPCLAEVPRGDCFADSTPLGFNTTQIPHFKTPKKISNSKLSA